ncbi:MAG: Beta-ketoadipate enol-lactone hydrolase [uncultured Rubrobacteraceae bacterium]|uniref:Beta-ketoadipate enol-lactone hydrolase n=1 Tax=uncultured Rubrobacteraceae bacterium TaxID=349277 RepID=A0A6J4PEU7_9ACTN|nr:MAG: Beta-ketoadipate enol-lactone hydrolase [uncultured Rubrobacteraceae bacterium]
MPVTITENTSIDYDVQGEGPPLLLVNGLGFGRWGWFKQVPAFTRHFQTITFDVRGERDLGNGVADLTAEAVALLDHLGVGKTHVLGTSLGGFVAQELALVRPDLVDRLVLVCTSYGGRGPQAMSPGALADMMGLGTFSAEAAARKALVAATGDAYREEKPEEFEQIVHWRLADSSSAASYYEQAKAGARFDLSGDVGHVTSPTLVIHGAEDRYVPPANARALADAIPGAKLRVLEDAGHLVFVERFADVNREVVRFLKSGVAGPARETGGPGPEGEPGESEAWFRGVKSAFRSWVDRARAWIGLS